MKYAFFLGCNIPARLGQYEKSARAVFGLLGVDLFDIKEFACCGYPVRNLDHTAFLLSAAHNMALAEQAGLDMLVLCKCGFGTFKEAQHQLSQQPGMREEINRRLAVDGLHYNGSVQVKHLLSVLYHDVGVEALKAGISRPFKSLPLAVHYGCHALRPSVITRFDDPVAPVIFDRLVEATGAASVQWSANTDCCGAPLMGINDALSIELMGRKLNTARDAGARFLCTSCPFCQIQFDSAQGRLEAERCAGRSIAPILYSQLLGLSMGLEGDMLGLSENRLDVTGITSYLS
jgi:heterodisulfide reductase subunit B2